MKKFFLFALAAAFAFTSCSKDETLASAQPGAIDFAVAANKTTRSNFDPSISTNGENGTKAISDFAVYGFMEANKADGSGTTTGDVFNDEVVRRNNGAWSYDHIQYWTKNKYYFAALAPAEPVEGRNWNVVATANKLGIGLVSFTNNGQQDLLYWANVLDNTQGAVEDAPVSIVFNHLLSKVKFSFVNAFENKLTSILVTGVKITNAYTEGSIHLDTEDWWSNLDAWGCEGEQTFAFGDVTTQGSESATADYKLDTISVGREKESHNEVLLFPANEKTYKIEFHVVVLNGEAIAAEYDHQVELTTTFKMGYSYDLKATLSAANVNPDEELKPIEFEVTEVKGWMQEGQDGEVALTANVKSETELENAIAKGIGMITLEADIELTKTLNFTNEQAVVLNLNGYKLTNKLGNATTDVIVVGQYAKLIVNGAGTVEAVSGNDGYAIISEGELVINGGTFKSGTDAAGAPNAVIYARGNGKVFVNGGEFPNDNTSKFVLNKKDADRANTVIEVSGGKFWNFNPGNNEAENPGTNFLATGYISKEVATNVWEVVKQ